MEIRIMGSGAAEGWPAVWCRCEACARARNAGGRSIRTRSGAIVDRTFKFDFPSDTYLQALRDGIDLSQVEHLIFTHTHQDHFYPQELLFRRPPFAHDTLPLHIWGNEWVLEEIQATVGDPERVDSTVHVLNAGETVHLGDARLTPLLASHFFEKGCFNYIFERGGRTLLYGQDSGWFSEEHWQAQRGHQFDVVILDCTGGPTPESKVHGSVETVIRWKERMLEEGTATSKTLFVANHFSHNGRFLHEQLEEVLSPHGVLVSYDGMVIEV